MPSSLLELVATVPASAGTASWTVVPVVGCDFVEPVAFSDGAAYYAVVLGAYSRSSHSVLAIADPGGWFGFDQDDPYLEVC